VNVSYKNIAENGRPISPMSRRLHLINRKRGIRAKSKSTYQRNRKLSRIDEFQMHHRDSIMDRLTALSVVPDK